MDNEDIEARGKANFFRSFDMARAWEETKKEFSNRSFQRRFAASAKLAGKALWNSGLYIARNAPKHLEEMMEQEKSRQAELEALKGRFERSSNEDLIAIINSKRDISERRIAYEIIKVRKEEHEAGQSDSL